jgi:RNA polymerase sigma-70 factor (ECF subfamily)
LNLLYQQYKPQLLNICRQYAKGDDVAEDLLHDAFVVIFTSLDRLENDDKLEAWMFSIVRNVGYHYRQHVDKEQAALQQLAKEKSETTETGHIADYNELQSLVTLLPQGYQQVFRLSVFEGLSHQEIGQLLGITPHSSSSQLSHAKRMLRRLIRQSWVLVLLFIAIPAAIWQFLKKDKEPENQLAVVSKTKPKPQPTPPVEKPD